MLYEIQATISYGSCLHYVEGQQTLPVIKNYSKNPYQNIAKQTNFSL